MSAGGFTTPRVQPLLLFSPSLCLFDYHSSFIHASQTNAGRKCTPCARRLKSPATSISAVEQPYSTISFTTARRRDLRSAFRSLVLKFETVYQRISNHHTISYDVSFRSRVKRSTVPFQRGPPSIFISLSVYTYATTRGCISRYDAAPPAFEKCVSSLSASTAGAHIRLCKHTRTLPSSANTLAVATSASASSHSQPVATQPTIHET